MAGDRFEQALAALDPSKRALLKRIVAGAAFAVPAIASFAVGDLASAQGTCVTTVTTILDETVTLTTTVTITTITATVTQTEKPETAVTTTTTVTNTITATVTSTVPA
jgi:hypothetical protein